ncbi:hypothetical protein BH23GEM9_BH23GEM9_29670 [soil metagenome]
MTVIAELDLIAISSTGRQEMRLRLEAPRKHSEGEWSCALSLEGLHDDILPIRGNDSLQALCLATGMAELLLRGFVAGGGRLEYDDGEIFPIDAYFMRPPDGGTDP